jgi:hypothetical protein
VCFARVSALCTTSTTPQDRGRRYSSPEAELDLDPNALLETDALGLSKAEKEAEEEERRLEESRCVCVTE